MKNVLMVILLLTGTGLWAGNSIFSFDGYPCQNYGRDIYSLGMGDTGASDIFRNNTGYANPAMHNRSNRTLFATGILMGYTTYKSQYQGTEQSFRDDALDFPYFNFSVPIKNHRVGFQFNSYASGVVNNKRVLDSGVVETQVADKYLYRADLIYSINLKHFNAGISGNFYFGHDNRRFKQNYDDWNFNTDETVITDFKNPGVTLGVLHSFSKLSLGLQYSPAISLKGETTRRAYLEAEPSQDYEYKLPNQIGFSSTWLPYPQFKMAADVNYEAHHQANATNRNTLKAGLGIAYEPVPELHRTAFMKLPVRTGVSFRQLAFPDKQGKDIDELAFSMGLTIPLKREVNRIDLGLQYLKRGNIDTNNLSDTSLMMMIGLTGFDIISKAKDNTKPREIPVKEELE